MGEYYVDMEMDCRMFHVCAMGVDGEVLDLRFMCLEGMVFSQQTRSCVENGKVPCGNATDYMSKPVTMMYYTDEMKEKDDKEEEDVDEELEEATEETTKKNKSKDEEETRKPSRSKNTRTPRPKKTKIKEPDYDDEDRDGSALHPVVVAPEFEVIRHKRQEQILGAPCYSYESMPRTSFSCFGMIPGGYYADMETSCQLYHVCAPGTSPGLLIDFKFLCTNNTVFDQQTRTCMDFQSVDCTNSLSFYKINTDLVPPTVVDDIIPPEVSEIIPVDVADTLLPLITLPPTVLPTQPPTRAPVTFRSSPRIVSTGSSLQKGRTNGNIQNNISKRPVTNLPTRRFQASATAASTFIPLTPFPPTFIPPELIPQFPLPTSFIPTGTLAPPEVTAFFNANSRIRKPVPLPLQPNVFDGNGVTGGFNGVIAPEPTALAPDGVDAVRGGGGFGSDATGLGAIETDAAGFDTSGPDAANFNVGDSDVGGSEAIGQQGNGFAQPPIPVNGDGGMFLPPDTIPPEEVLPSTLPPPSTLSPTQQSKLSPKPKAKNLPRGPQFQRGPFFPPPDVFPPMFPQVDPFGPPLFQEQFGPQPFQEPFGPQKSFNDKSQQKNANANEKPQQKANRVPSAFRGPGVPRFFQPDSPPVDQPSEFNYDYHDEYFPIDLGMPGAFKIPEPQKLNPKTVGKADNNKWNQADGKGGMAEVPPLTGDIIFSGLGPLPAGSEFIQVWFQPSPVVVHGISRVIRQVSSSPAFSQHSLPSTSFTCRDKISGGYYADLETYCQMFHVCARGNRQEVFDFKFLCTNDTVFNQRSQTCEVEEKVDCQSSPVFYPKDAENDEVPVPNAEIGRVKRNHLEVDEDIEDLPRTTFSCAGKHIGGYFADPDTDCRTFHVCTRGETGDVFDFQFRCANNTAFNQQSRICDEFDQVDCNNVEGLFNSDDEFIDVPKDADAEDRK